jgi:hypothetical protein
MLDCLILPILTLKAAKGTNRVSIHWNIGYGLVLNCVHSLESGGRREQSGVAKCRS